MKTKLLKLLCLNLSVCLLTTAMPVTNIVYANSHTTENIVQNVIEESTEYETDTFKEESEQEALTEESYLREETEIQEESDSEGYKTEETKTEEAETIESEINESQIVEQETQTSETEEIIETETEEISIEESENEQDVTKESLTEEILIEEVVTEEASIQESQIDEDIAFKQELLEKVKEFYPEMYINESGLFEYIDENGKKQTYDPYDPEFSKYMLQENLITQETDDEYDMSVSEEALTTISPFTGKTYIHEPHVSNKLIKHGIDVSKYQRDVDWAKAKAAGVDFAIVRVGYRGYGAAGTMGGDAYAVQNIKNAYNAGVKVGIYFFSQAVTEAEAEEEALYCHNFIQNNNLKQYITLPVFIDYEYSPTGTSGRLYDAHLTNEQRQSICDKFCSVIKKYGYEPGIYANFAMLTDDMYPTQSPLYSDTCYWIARYNNATKYPNKYTFWQYSSQGTVDGITGLVDCNFWYDNKRLITDSSIRVSIDEECDYVSDINDSITIYDTLKNYTLKEGKDYAIKLVPTTEDGINYVIVGIAAIGEYEGTITKKVKITQMTLSDEMVSDIPDQIYTGNEITVNTGLKVIINHAGEILQENKDYTLSYENNIKAGTATVNITGVGNFTGEIQKKFKIKPMTISQEMVSQISDMYYTGSKITTETGVELKLTNPNTSELLTQNTDYTLTYKSNQNIGTAKIIITGKGNYTGNLKVDFNILKAIISDQNTEIIIGEGNPYITKYTGKAIKPSVTVKVNGITLKKSEYDIEYKNNIEPTDKATVVIKGKNNYEGSSSRLFTIEPNVINPVKLTSKMVSLESTVVRATGSSIKPEICVVQNGNILTENTDYTVSYTDSNKSQVTDIINAGIYNIKVTGIGNYKGTVTKSFEIIDADKKIIGKEYTEVIFNTENSYIYTGNAIEPDLKVTDKTLDNKELVNGVDYTLSYTDNINASIARFIIKGKGEYTGSYTGTFKIAPISIGNLTQTQEGTPIQTPNTQISLNKYEFDYNAKTQIPVVTIKHNNKKLKENTDYEITYNSTYYDTNLIYKRNADIYKMNITFKGNYEGTATLSYKINQIDISNLKITVSKQKYKGGEPVFPTISEMTFKLGNKKLESDSLYGIFTGGWSNNAYVTSRDSKAYFTITCTMEKSNFILGSVKELYFDIEKTPINSKNLEYTIGGVKADGSTSELELIYNGMEYNGSNGADIVIKVADSDTRKVLVENEDYKLKYSKNKNVGTAKVKITGIDGFKGSKTIKFKIIGKPIGDGQAYEGYKLVLNDSETVNYVYNGKAIKPKVKLYEGTNLLKKNKDYTVKYENNINAGEASIIVNGKGKYSGTIRQSFTINPKQKSDAKNIKVSNIPDQKYTGRVIVPSVKVTIDGKTLKKGKDYTISVVNSTKLTYEDKQGKKGVATVIITGTGNYKGVLTKKSFVVVK